MAYVKGNDLKELIAKVLFTGAMSPPATYYLGLGTGPLPAADATVATLAEVTGPGYSRKALARGVVDFPTFLLSGNVAKITSVVKNFAASGTWTNADWVFLTDSASGAGKFLGAVNLDEPFRLLGGDDTDAVFEYQDQ